MDFWANAAQAMQQMLSAGSIPTQRTLRLDSPFDLGHLRRLLGLGDRDGGLGGTGDAHVAQRN